MKFPKLFGKKDDDDDFEDDDFEDEAFDVDDLDDHVGDLDEDEEAVSEPDNNNHDDNEDPGEIMVGGDDELDDPFDDIDDDFDDEFDDDEYEDDEESSKRRAILFAAIGAGVILLSALGGFGWWFFSSDEEQVAAVEKPKDPGRVEMAMPAPKGSLNASLGGQSLIDTDSQGGPDAIAPEASSSDNTQQSAADESSFQAAESGSEGGAAPTLNAAGGGGLNALNSGRSAGGGLVVPAVGGAAMAKLPDHPTAADQSQGLSAAPVSALIEEKDDIGNLPKIASNGAQSWQAYARPTDPGLTQPKIALMFDRIGLSRQASLGAINKLPPEVSMLLSPYGRDLNDWVFRSRLAGHEVFMSLPMESEDFPIEDAGPLALDTRIQLVENQRRLHTVMASAEGYVGMVTMMGSRFMKAEGQIRKVLDELKARGLMFVIGGQRKRNDAIPIAEAINIPRAESEMYIDDIPRIQQIREKLDSLESLARDRGVVLAMARPYPVTIKSVLDWIATLPDKGVILVPASAAVVWTAEQGG